MRIRQGARRLPDESSGGWSLAWSLPSLLHLLMHAQLDFFDRIVLSSAVIVVVTVSALVKVEDHGVTLQRSACWELARLFLSVCGRILGVL